APDVAFVSWDRIPERKMPTEPIPGLTPDLAIEVLSESNTKAEMERKRRDYFDAGTKLVWEVDPDARTVAVFEGASESRTLSASESLAAPILLPGFAMSLADLFAELDRQG
ncbi:MAG TPA: Uma2 family endonuclease, partial [Planctomycetia bacterium]|nr:Uma2 family endonuclease [Planctomycetia bacterium]